VDVTGSLGQVAESLSELAHESIEYGIGHTGNHKIIDEYANCQLHVFIIVPPEQQEGGQKRLLELKGSHLQLLDDSSR
jgi:hypothetical protein